MQIAIGPQWSVSPDTRTDCEPNTCTGYELIRDNVTIAVEQIGSKTTPKKTAILHACRQVHAEAEGFLYAGNYYSLGDLEDVQGFVELMGKRIQHVQYLSIAMAECEIEEKHAANALKPLQSAINLKVLQFGHMDMCLNDNAERIGHACKELLSTLKKSRLAAGKKNAAHIADVLQIELGNCYYCELGRDEPHGRFFHPGDQWDWCGCEYEDATDRNKVMEAVAKKVVREYLEEERNGGGVD